MAIKQKNNLPKETLTYRGAKRLAIQLGMPFPDALMATYHELDSYITHSKQPLDAGRVIEYDKWRDQLLADLGHDEQDVLRARQLTLSYVSDDKPQKPLKTPKASDTKTSTRLKKVREKDPDSGLIKGTKKALTKELADKGFSLERVIRKVTAAFPTANERSIRQWYKKFNKESNG